MYKNVNTHIEEAKRRREENQGWPPEAALVELISSNFWPKYFSGDNLLLWLSLWAEIARQPAPQGRASRTLQRLPASSWPRTSRPSRRPAARRSTRATLARNFIALIDGLWLEWCLDETVLTPEAAEAAGFEMIEAQVGPLRS